MPHEYQLNEIEKALIKIEPDASTLERELRILTTYLVKIGSDVQIALDRKKRHRLKKHQELEMNQIVNVITKYKLAEQGPLSLITIAHNFPCIAIDVAASMTPGNFDERRFWWCANNYDFYLKYSLKATEERGDRKNGFSSSRLLSDVLCELLTLSERKLITISALHLSIKHSDSKVYFQWFHKNRKLIIDRIENDTLGRERPKMKERLRKMCRIEETEAELDQIYVEDFIDWWNLTGLKRNDQARGQNV